MTWRTLNLGSFLAISTLLAGCGGAGDAPNRTLVSGTVTYEGAPVQTGQILMVPADGTGRPDAGEIKDGKFEFEVTPGNKQVEFSAMKEDGVAPDGLPNYVPLLPPLYGAGSPVTADVQSSGENVFEFKLDKKGSF